MHSTRQAHWVTAAVLAFALPAWGQPPQTGATAKARVDLYGDPLPAGAIARLGTVRFRHRGALHAVAFSNDGKLVAASSEVSPWTSQKKCTVIIWERSTGRKVCEIETDGDWPWRNLRFSANDKLLYGQGPFWKWDAWNTATGAHAKDVPPLPNEASVLGYSMDSREAILADDDNIIRWDIARGTELARFPLKSTRSGIADLPSTRILLPRFDGKAVGMWDAAANRQLWSARAARNDIGVDPPMTLSADSTVFAVEVPDGAIVVYDSVTGKLIRRLAANGDGAYHSISISPDGQTVAGNTWDTVRLWDLKTGREQVKLPGMRSTTDVFFSPDSTVFTTVGGLGGPNAVMLWETATGKPIDACIGHAGNIASLVFAPDGQTVATTSSSSFFGRPRRSAVGQADESRTQLQPMARHTRRGSARADRHGRRAEAPRAPGHRRCGGTAHG